MPTYDRPIDLAAQLGAMEPHATTLRQVRDAAEEYFPLMARAKNHKTLESQWDKYRAALKALSTQPGAYLQAFHNALEQSAAAYPN